MILDVTKTESIAAATEWVKERVGDRGMGKFFLLSFTYLGMKMLTFYVHAYITYIISKAGLERLALSFEKTVVIFGGVFSLTMFALKNEPSRFQAVISPCK